VALHVEDELVARRPGLHARELKIERRLARTSKKPPVLPAAAFAVLKARSVLAAPQAETRNCLLFIRSFLKNRGCSCASRFAARLAPESGTGTNSPFEVLSSLIGRRLPSGSMRGSSGPGVT
jgi:hypothetical protein